MTMLEPLLAPLLPMIEPTLDLDLTAATLDQRITVTRASTKTHYDSAGFMRTAAVNEFPVEYDPSTVTRVNYAQGSRTLAGSILTNCVPTPNYSVAPDGQTRGILVSTSTAGGTGVSGFSVIVTPRLNETTVCWAYLRAGTVRYVRLRPLNFNNTPVCEVDLLTGTIVGSSDPTSFIEPVGDGIYRVGVVKAAETDVSGVLNISALSAPGNPGVALDGAQNFEFFGIQVEPGTTPTELIETGSVPAGNGVCLGRSVWEARTNLALVSEDFSAAQWGKANVNITTNVETAPTNTTAMDLVEFTATGGRLTQARTGLTIGGTYTVSIFVKKAASRYFHLALSSSTGLVSYGGLVFDFDTGELTHTESGGTWTYVPGSARREYVGGGVYRLSVAVVIDAILAYLWFASSATPDAIATGQLGDSFYGWGAQLEAATFAGPYIPVPSTSTVTRSGDSAYVVLSASPQRGTILAEGKLAPGFAPGLFTQTLASLSSATNTGIHLDVLGSGQCRALVWSGGSLAAGANIYPLFTATAGQYLKAALAFATDDVRATAAGAAVSSDTSVTIPTTTRLELGNFFGANQRSLNGHLQRVRLWDPTLSSPELQGLTG